MTSQNVQATISNGAMGKVFTKSDATDGQWDSNTLTDSLSSQQLGILMPNTVITSVQCQYTAGLSAWRIQNSANLTFQRWGFGVKDGLACYQSQSIAPYRINPNDIFTVYPLAVNGAVDTTSTLAWVHTSKGVELFSSVSLNDTATPMTTVVNGQSLGDSMFNSTLRSIHVQAEDGATVDSVEIIDNSGGTVLTLYGGVRGNTAGAMSLEFNLEATGLATMIGKGYALKITTTTG